MGNLRGVLNKIRLVIFLVIGLPCLLFVGMMAAWNWWSGTGTVRVQAPAGDSATVSIDRAAPEQLFGGQTLRRALPQGVHHVDVTTAVGTRSYDVRISSGFWDQLLPATSSQCWVDLDVYDVYYSASEGPAKVEARHAATEPFDVPGGAYLSASELPPSVTEGGTVHLLRPMPCSLMAASDAQILAAVPPR